MGLDFSPLNHFKDHGFLLCPLWWSSEALSRVGVSIPSSTPISNFHLQYLQDIHSRDSNSLESPSQSIRSEW